MTMILSKDVPCGVCSSDTRWLFAASVPADSGSSYEVEDHLADLDRRENTCRVVDTCADVVDVEAGVR